MVRFWCSLFVIVMAVLGTSCTGTRKNNSEIKKGSNDVNSAVNSGFPYPEIPIMMVNDEERREYLLVHYWDNFNFGDTVLVNDRDVTEEAFANQLSIFMEGWADRSLVAESVDNLCSGMEKYSHSRRVLMNMFDYYLYNPNSPYYNEEIYLIYLERMAGSRFLDDARKGSLLFKRDLIRRNRPGSVASDFDYFLENGKRMTLMKTDVEGEYLLLVFYAPQCPSCMETMLAMTGDSGLDEAVRKGMLTVLAVYTEGNEDEWKSSLKKLPDGWINGNDRMMVMDKALYDLKAMPSLYLLDKNKKVLLKDAPYQAVRQYLGID